MGFKKSSSTYKFNFFADSQNDLVTDNFNNGDHVTGTEHMPLFTVVFDSHGIVVDLEEDKSPVVERSTVSFTNRRHNVKVLPILPEIPDKRELVHMVQSHTDKHGSSSADKTFLQAIFNLDQQDGLNETELKNCDE